MKKYWIKCYKENNQLRTMKVIIVIIFCIASSKCRVLNYDMQQSNLAAPYNLLDTQLTDVIDIFDVTKTQEEELKNKNYYLQPGLHIWEPTFQPSQQSADEIDRIRNIIEENAIPKLKLVRLGESLLSESEDDMVTRKFNINNVMPNEQTSKKYKRDIEFKNKSQSTDTEEIKHLLSNAEAAGNKNGKADINCKTTDGVIICHVYIPKDPALCIHKREIESQNNTPPINENETEEKPEIVTPAANPILIVDENGNTCTEISTVTVDNKVLCLVSPSSAFVGGCPAGTDRAADNTCVPVVQEIPSQILMLFSDVYVHMLNTFSKN